MDGASDKGFAFNLLDLLNDSAVVTDAQFQAPGPRIIYANDAFAATFGRSTPEVAGQPLSSIEPWFQSEELLTELKQCCLEGRTYEYQNPPRSINGDASFATAWRISPVFHGSSIRNLVCLASREEVTPDPGDALDANAKLYRDLFEHGLVAKAILSPDGHYIKVNQSFCDLLGYDREELEGSHVSIVIKETEREKVLENIRRLVDGEIPGYQVERQYVHKDGHIVTALVDVAPEKDNKGNTRSVIAQAQDISSLKATEAALRDIENRLWDFAEIAADWFWETDENLVITYISDVHRQITGIPDDRIIGHTREELFKDKIYKATNPAIHLRLLRNYWDSMVEYSVTREDGREIVVHDRASPFFDHQGNFKGYRGIGRDITEQRLLTERIAYQASRDSLTGAVNRREFERKLEELIEEARSGGSEHVLCFVDLDKFKLLNDTLGHAAGDHLLKTVVEKISKNTSPGDVVGRIGGDEFGILFRNMDLENAKRRALKSVRAIKSHDFKWRERTFNVGMSVGLAAINNKAKSGSETMALADAACYRAKQAGGGGACISEENEAVRLRIYTDILRSLASGPVDLSENFKLVGQPIRALESPEHSPPWYEVLLRLVGEDGRYYRPIEFIRLAEQYGKMPMVDLWVLETAIQSHADIVSQITDAVMSINLSGTSLSDSHLESTVYELVKKYKLRPENICFEIGEQTAMTDLKSTVALVDALSERGYRIALDEFGSGPSSFACLKHLRINYVKLYGNLVREMRQSGPDIAIVESINELSHRLDLSTIAVQVETKQAVDTLKKIGIEYGQGDALATSRPLDELLVDLARNYRN